MIVLARGFEDFNWSGPHPVRAAAVRSLGELLPEVIASYQLSASPEIPAASASIGDNGGYRDTLGGKHR